jgi:DNA-binding transcriptional LysR family regulator
VQPTTTTTAHCGKSEHDDRRTRRLTPTPAGEAWLEHCVAALAELERGEDALKLAQNTLCGKVRIDLPTAFGRRCVMPVLLDLVERYPSLLLNVSFTDRLVDLIGENIDLAVRIGNLADSPDLVAKRVGVQHMAITGAPAYFAARGIPHSASDLAHHDCIVGRRQERRSTWLLKQANGSIVPHAIPAKYEIRDFEMIQVAARAGRGLAQLPFWMIQNDIQEGALMTVLDGLSGGEMPINIIWPQATSLPTKVRVVVDALIEEVPRLIVARAPRAGAGRMKRAAG